MSERADLRDPAVLDRLERALTQLCLAARQAVEASRSETLAAGQWLGHDALPRTRRRLHVAEEDLSRARVRFQATGYVGPMRKYEHEEEERQLRLAQQRVQALQDLQRGCQSWQARLEQATRELLPILRRCEGSVEDLGSQGQARLQRLREALLKYLQAEARQ